MKVGILVGTRPEVIKMAPVIRECQNREIDFVLIHSNQHYSESMDAIFFKELNLPAPHYNLNVGSAPHGNQIGNILIKLEPILLDEKIDVLLVQGDTNTVASGALAASKNGIKVGHIEAGLRSYDRKMPEEGNRVMTDHLSDYLFAVSGTQVEILNSEGVSPKKIHRVGNTIVDAVLQNKDIAEKKSTILNELNLNKGEYTLFTAHRASNVDVEVALKETLDIIKEIPGPVCWPVHLRAKKNIEKFKLKLPDNVVETTPIGYFDFLNLEMHSKLIVTDSGGLQEEACILGIPCITIRENTERPETVSVGANILVGRDIEKFKAALKAKATTWKNPFGDGTTAKKIIDTLQVDFNIPLEKPKQKNKSIAVVGMGYMGLPTSTLLATSGYKVTGVDINKEKIDNLNNGIVDFDEPGVDELLQKAISYNSFRADLKMPESDIYIVAVPTPHKNEKCDLTYVLQACENIAKACNDESLVIIESTIKPNTCEKYVKPIFDKMNKKVHIVHCPERAIPGNTIHELINNDRIIGGLTKESTEMAFELYKSFCKGEIFKTKAINAECAKLMENTFRDVNIALANEYSVISKDIGFDVLESIQLANRHPRVNILKPGAGVGGHCIPIDPWFLTEDTDKAKLIKTAREVNDNKPIHYIKTSLEDSDIKNPKVAILGVAYKPNVDDARETPCEYICDYLKENNIEFKVTDPYVNSWKYKIESLDSVLAWADVSVIVTEHDIYKKLAKSKNLIYPS